MAGADRDLGRGDFVSVDCPVCHHAPLLTPEALLKLGLSLAAKVLDLTMRGHGRACGVKGRAAVSLQ